ncbi:alpha/beta fold hydrolase [Ideonella sp. BN130291]|uniref:alpha/beta fold hydrolase n=1 Tax=Ideonella sp. BN130291 TaxID=3112940 RepID=UPI002E25E506|nr:alpha/beta fold hydrolase [Ideonella sp. BN130291]
MVRLNPCRLLLLLACMALPASAADAGLAPCRLRGLAHEALCGVLQRPLDPAQPQGRQIELHYAVVPALARNKKPDPVFFFAGGPGQSAIELAGPLAAAHSRFLNRRDLVLVDQRGTGRSAPLKCDDDDAGRPLAQALDPAQQQRQLAACRDALQRLPHGDLRFYTTTLAMQDADAVRQALGVERFNAIGASYGTRAVLEYMRQFPQRVRRAVIDGVAPPDMVLPAAFSTDNQAALDSVFSACEADPACAARYPQLRARWHGLLESLPRAVSFPQPLTGQRETVLLQRDLLLSMVRQPLYVPALAAGLPNAIAEASAGRFDALAALASALQGRHKAMAMSEGMHFSVVCAEDVPRLDAATDSPGADFRTGFAQLYRQVCAQWPRGEVPTAFYRMPVARGATLLLSGASDPVTPPRHAERAAKALGPKARHLVVPHAGHGVMGIGCLRDVVYRFVDAETDDAALKLDARCVGELPRPPAFMPLLPPAPAASAATVTPVAPAARRQP